jgi:hypothetical protein
MEQQVDVANDGDTVGAKEGDIVERSNKSPGVTKRTPRMLHESSFATSTFTSSGGSRRPPGFVASSLDYKMNYESDMENDHKKTKLLNPKPSNRVLQKRQQEENQLKQQQQQAKQKKNVLPTRAKGNYGPPPHQITSLEDLEHMTEDQLYRLFMEDPELYRSLLKSTGEDQSSSASSDSSRARKTNGNSRSHQSSKRSLQARFGDDKEIPYFQWLVLIALMGLGLYQLRKSMMTDPVKQKRGSTTSIIGVASKGKGGKQKKQKIKKDKIPNEQNKFGSEKAQESSKSPQKKIQPNTVTTATVPSEDPPQNKKKKKSKQPGHATTKPGEDDPSRVNATAPTETNEVDTPVVTQMGTFSIETENEEDGEAWQTVAKSREAKAVSNGAKSSANNSSDRLMTSVKPPKNAATEPPGNVESSSEPNVQPNEKETDVANDSTLVEIQRIDFPSSGIQDNTGSNTKKKKKKTKHSKIPSANNHVVVHAMETASTDDDAALALQLQKEEETLARDEKNDEVLQEEAWEEVTNKKKRG